VGVGDYISDNYNDLSSPPYNVDKIRQILSYCKFSPSNIEFSTINYLKDWQATESNILQSIVSTFAGADSNDVSYFYFSGHGGRIMWLSYLCPADSSPYVHITVSELEKALSVIPGTKVVILDCCYSGGFIKKGKDEISQDDLINFNNDIIDIFFRGESKSLLTTNQYKVLTSCHYDQTCYEAYPEGEDPIGIFTMALCDGCGYSGNYPADINLDTKVSLQEAYLYVKDWVQQYYSYRDQDVQVYPSNSNFTIVEY